MDHDSILGGKLDTVKFVIDQVNGRIFNPDSLPFGTEIEKVVCTVSVATGTYTIEVTQDALPDSTFYWNREDSLDFSKPCLLYTSGLTAEGIAPAGKGSTTAMYVKYVKASDEIMPQYLFAVDTVTVNDGKWCATDEHGYIPVSYTHLPQG